MGPYDMDSKNRKVGAEVISEQFRNLEREMRGTQEFALNVTDDEVQSCPQLLPNANLRTVIPMFLLPPGESNMSCGHIKDIADA